MNSSASSSSLFGFPLKPQAVLKEAAGVMLLAAPEVLAELVAQPTAEKVQELVEAKRLGVLKVEMRPVVMEAEPCSLSLTVASTPDGTKP